MPIFSDQTPATNVAILLFLIPFTHFPNDILHRVAMKAVKRKNQMVSSTVDRLPSVRFDPL